MAYKATHFNTLGLGANVPIVTGNLSDGYHALVDGKFITLRVPYPMGFFATNSTRTPFHNEGGTANQPNVVRFQMRPDPLAR